VTRQLSDRLYSALVTTYLVETSVAGPIQTLGMSYYFDSNTAELAAGLGLNVFEFYGLGRAGVLGDVDADTVTEAFYFFHDNAIDMLWTRSREKGDIEVVVPAHLEAAYQYAERTFAAIDEATLRDYADAARIVIDAVPGGRYALFDGYRAAEVPASPVRAAYLATILLRELRGGVHIDSVKAVEIAAAHACYATNASIFKLHGYSEDDAPTPSDELTEAMQRAETMTTTQMAVYLEVLNAEQLSAFEAGVNAMAAAQAAGGAA